MASKATWSHVTKSWCLSATRRPNAKVRSTSPQIKKTTDEQIKDKNNADLLLRQSRLFTKSVVPPGQTINQQFYCECPESLRKRVLRARPGIVGSWMLYHDNAPCHTIFDAKIHLCSLSPILPWLVPKWLFEFEVTLLELWISLKKPWAWRTNRWLVTGILLNNLQDCYDEWEKRLQHCVVSQGNNFESDNVQLQLKNK